MVTLFVIRVGNWVKIRIFVDVVTLSGLAIYSVAVSTPIPRGSAVVSSFYTHINTHKHSRTQYFKFFKKFLALVHFLFY